MPWTLTEVLNRSYVNTALKKDTFIWTHIYMLYIAETALENTKHITPGPDCPMVIILNRNICMIQK